jgi:hypothetical protein
MADYKITERVRVNDTNNTFENNGRFFYGALSQTQINALV